MEYRMLGKTGFKVSAVSFGSWAIGGTWGNVKDEESIAALNKAIDMGVNFIDTADVYGGGRSEKLVAGVVAKRSEKIYIATKIGRKLNPHTAEGYNRKNLTEFLDQCLKNLKTDSLDLVQLHCPPTEVYYNPEVFSIMDDFQKQGKIQNYGVSVEKIEEALKAIEFPNVKTVQVIFNMFRHRPCELFFDQAKKCNIGILARVPLASGMLTGKMTKDTGFAPDDHRSFNRHGESFDKGETFSGVDYDTALKAVDELKKIVPVNMSLIQFALRWILMFDAVSCAIPGSKRPDQAEQNFNASDFPPLTGEVMDKVKAVYDKYIKDPVHYLW